MKIIAVLAAAGAVVAGCATATPHEAAPSTTTAAAASTPANMPTAYEQYSQYLIEDNSSIYMRPHPTLGAHPVLCWPVKGPVAQALPTGGGPGIPPGTPVGGVWGRYNDGSSLYILDDIIEMWPSDSVAKDQVAAARRSLSLNPATADVVLSPGASNIPHSANVGDGGFVAMGTIWPGPATLSHLEWTVKSNWISVLAYSYGRFSVTMEFWTLPPGPNGCAAPHPDQVIAAGQDQLTYLPR